MRQATSPTAIGVPLAAPTKKDATQWLIQAGIAKNWFGIGNTALYGEYGVATDWGAEAVGRNFAGNSAVELPSPAANSVCTPTLLNFTTVNGVTDTEMRIWGMGITQNVDAAASTLYLGYRQLRRRDPLHRRHRALESARVRHSLPARRARTCRPSRSTPSSAARW